MREQLKQKCDLFVKNKNIMSANFPWDFTAFHALGASIYMTQNREIDPNDIKWCKRVIKQNTGVFSNFKSTSFLALATMLSTYEEPEEKFVQIKEVYELLKKEFYGSAYLPLCAMIITEMVEKDNYEQIIRKASTIYKIMKKDHPFLTSGEDASFAVMFALSSISEEKAGSEMEKCFQLLKGKFLSANAVQSLSHVLTLGEEDAQIKCDRTMELFNRFKEERHKYGTGIELATLGVLVLTKGNIEQIVADVLEVYKFLAESKGFSSFSVTKTQKLMYASMIVANSYKQDSLSQTISTTAVTSITSLVIAEQIAIMAAISACAAASSASS